MASISFASESLMDPRIQVKLDKYQKCGNIRTSDGGNGNHSVSLPIILIKIKVDQMLPSSYISLLLVSIL